MFTKLMLILYGGSQLRGAFLLEGFKSSIATTAFGLVKLYEY